MSKQGDTLMSFWSLYMLRTCKGLLYTGISTDIERRVREHENGKGAKSLRGKGPLKLEYVIEIGDRGRAQRLEAAIKKLTRSQKEALISKHFPLPEID